MTDLWSFLLQTLTASGAAALLLAVKALFRDKLTPRWQFAAWGPLALLLLLPAGLGGRWALFNWPLVVEQLRTALVGDYGFTRVLAPVPLPPGHAPATIWDWLFLLYALGVLALLLFHTLAYVRLRWALRRGTPADPAMTARIAAVAERYALRTCPAVVVPELKTAFVCGVFHPVLALPEGVEVDDKVLLHELLHRSHHDTVWSVVICVFRCLHWCNPLLWVCADQAGNDLEALCDQRVLEHLEGEERRDYGRILLSMASERYARAVGTSSVANGGRRIRQRIEAIARFRRYPAGMDLVSVCVLLLLTVPLLVGSRSPVVSPRLTNLSFVEPGGGWHERRLASLLAEARATPCTTAAGALDSYAKALLTENPAYRAMCLPEADQQAFGEKILAAGEPIWDTGLTVKPWAEAEYQLYNLRPAEDGLEGTLVLRQFWEPLVLPEAGETPDMKIAVQQVRVEQERGRWVVRPLTAPVSDLIPECSLYWGELNLDPYGHLPSNLYVGEGADFRVTAQYTRVASLDNAIAEPGFLQSSTRFDFVPRPNDDFDQVRTTYLYSAEYLGEDSASIETLGISTEPYGAGESRPTLALIPAQVEGSGGSSGGTHWSNRHLDPGWGPEVPLGGGGGSDPYDSDTAFAAPAAVAADLYLNGEKAAELTLLPEEVPHD